jgi:3-hydroxyisobutyrate dehydrogenase-like beta-hydroxyacid dehydrogenase
MRIGFVGTGSMGNPIASNVRSAGHEVFVHDLNREATENLISAGATWCDNPAEAARTADLIFLSLPSHVEVESVCFGEFGLFSTVQPGTYLIDLTTISVSLIPLLVEAQRTYGIRYLASPVSQGVDNARLGRLSLFVGGDRADYEYCLPIYHVLGRTIIYTGDHFSAISAKLLTNLLWYINAAAIGEALVIGAKSGIDLATLQQVVVNSCGTSWVADHDIPSIYDGTFDATFTTKLCCKDLRLISELATKLNVPIELGAVVEQIFRRAENLYGGDSPELSIVRHLQEVTHANLQLPQPTTSSHGRTRG